MLKKNSWIAALVLALSLTAFLFTGCVSPLKVEEDNEVYEEYPLDKGYNAWAGQVYQKGWAIGGIKFQGKGDAITVAKDLGYDIDMFQRATKLKIEMPDASYPRSGVDIIWGGEDASGDSGKAGGMWNQQPIAGGSGDVDPTFAKKDGNVLIIDLTKALKNYSVYTKAAKLKIVMQVNAPSYGDVEGLVQKAYLMIPATPPPFVPVTDVSLVATSKSMRWTSELALAARISPSNATDQAISWAIQSFKPKVGPDADKVIALPDLDPSDQTSVDAYQAAKKKLFGYVRFQQEEYIYDDTVIPNEVRLKDVPGVLIAPGETPGTITIVATIKEATKDNSGKFEKLEQDLSVTVVNPEPFTFKLGSSDIKTVYYSMMDNYGLSGSEIKLVKKNNTDTDYTGFTVKFIAAYGNSYYYIMVDFGSEAMKDYKGIKFKYTGIGEPTDEKGGNDYNKKNIRIKASNKRPKSGKYNLPDYYIAIDQENCGDVSGGTVDKNGNILTDGTIADIDIPFFTYPDNAADSLKKDIDKSKTTAELINANKVYFCINPWGGAMSFKITDFEVYK